MNCPGRPSWANCCLSCEDIWIKTSGASPFAHIFMVCSDCGNKRCPRATHHDRDCTRSNESGQPGSVFQ